MIVDTVVQEHVETAAFQWAQWKTLSNDDPADRKAVNWVANRLEGHLDGIRIAGSDAWPLIINAFETYPERGEMFVFAFLALELGDDKRLQQAASSARTTGDGLAGFTGAFAWQPPDLTARYVREWIAVEDPVKAGAAVAALIAQRYDPGRLLVGLLSHPHSVVCADACRLAGLCGRLDLMDRLSVLLRDGPKDVQLSAARALITLGSDKGLDVLTAGILALDDGWTRDLRALVKNLKLDDLRAWLTALSPSPTATRLQVRAAGMIGSPIYAKWLIAQMEIPDLAEDAGKAFVELFPDAWDEDLFSLEAQDFDHRFAEILEETDDPLPVAPRFKVWLEQQDAQ